MPQPARHAVPFLRLIGVVLGWALAVTLVLRFFDAVSLLFLGVLAAASVAALLRPLVDRLPLRRGLAAVVVGAGFVLAVGAVATAAGWLVSGPVKRELNNWPQTQQRIDAKLAGWSECFALTDPVTTTSLGRQIGQFLFRGDTAKGMAGVALNVLVALAFIFIGSVYFLADRHDRLVSPALPLLPPDRRPQLRAALDDLGPQLRWWLIGVMISMSLVGMVSAVGYKLAGLKFALPLAVVAAVAELVPTIGPLTAFAIALLLAATEGSRQFTGTLAVWAVVQTLESYVILPLVMKRAVHMPAVVTLFSVVFWGEIFGTAGLFMAVPINLLIWALLDHMIIRPRRARQIAAGPSSGAPAISGDNS
jgi:predicted PurR-regulated permease PerM